MHLALVRPVFSSRATATATATTTATTTATSAATATAAALVITAATSTAQTWHVKLVKLIVQWKWSIYDSKVAQAG